MPAKHKDQAFMWAADFEAYLDGMADAAALERVSLELSKSPDSISEYVDQLRIHYLLKEEAALMQAVSPRRLVWKRAAVIFLAFAVSGIGGYVAHRKMESRHAETIGQVLLVEPVETVVLSQDELELCKARYASDRSFAHTTSEPIMKYEPGSVANPGAAIEILEIDCADGSGRSLHVGDRVWRERLELTDGYLRFRLGNGCMLSATGPAVVRISDSKRICIDSGSVFVDAHDRVEVCLGVRTIAVSQASFGVVVSGADGEADLLVTDGLVLMGKSVCLKPSDGVRLCADGSMQRYRSVQDGSSLRERLRSGVRSIRIVARR